MAAINLSNHSHIDPLNEEELSPLSTPMDKVWCKKLAEESVVTTALRHNLNCGVNMTETVEYKGIQIIIRTPAISKGRWTWEYSILDQRTQRNGDGYFKNEQLAFDEALEVAKRDIDCLARTSNQAKG